MHFEGTEKIYNIIICYIKPPISYQYRHASHTHYRQRHKRTHTFTHLVQGLCCILVIITVRGSYVHTHSFSACDAGYQEPTYLSFFALIVIVSWLPEPDEMIHEVIERVQFENESIKVCDSVLNTYTKPQPHVLANPCIEYKRPASLPQYQLPFQLQMQFQDCTMSCVKGFLNPKILLNPSHMTKYNFLFHPCENSFHFDTTDFAEPCLLRLTLKWLAHCSSQACASENMARAS